MTPEEIFTRRLRETLNQRGWSQAELQRRLSALGYPRDKSVISKLMSGDRRVTLNDAVALAAALDVPLHALLLTREQSDQVALAGKLEVRVPFAAAWLAGVMPLDRDDVEDYEGVGSDLFNMALVDEKLPDLLSTKPNRREIEMTRAYVALKIKTADLMEEIASRADVPPPMAGEMRDVARGSRESAARIEDLLPKERKR